jgi:uncharacterized protein DUF2786
MSVISNPKSGTLPVGKIKALLSKTIDKGCTPGEAESARAKAFELMTSTLLGAIEFGPAFSKG